jgi:hypothetical protein
VPLPALGTDDVSDCGRFRSLSESFKLVSKRCPANEWNASRKSRQLLLYPRKQVRPPVLRHTQSPRRCSHADTLAIARLARLTRCQRRRRAWRQPEEPRGSFKARQKQFITPRYRAWRGAPGCRAVSPCPRSIAKHRGLGCSGTPASGSTAAQSQRQRTALRSAATANVHKTRLTSPGLEQSRAHQRCARSAAALVDQQVPNKSLIR